MQKCPRCGRNYDESWKVCIKCDVPLESREDRLTRLEKQAEQILREIREIREGTLGVPGKTDVPKTKEEVFCREQPVVVAAASSGEEDTEMQIGKYLLNKIGVVSLVAGIAFFIAYTFRYLTPLAKIFISYLISLGLLFWGIRLEKNVKFEKYGKSLIAGGWALIYFITFAIYHVQAVRIIHSQTVDLLLLSAVVGSMIAHLLKYKSQSVVALVLFLGYFTAGISQVSSFTLIYITLLTIIAAALAYKMNWYELPLFSMLATYLTHFLWTRPQMRFSDVAGVIIPHKFWIAFGFVVVYWITYTILSFIIKAEQEGDKWTITNSIFLNSLCFGLMGGVAFQEFNPALRFRFFLLSSLCVAAISLLARVVNSRKYLFHPYLVAAVVFLTSALPFKLNREWVNIVWLVEIPLLTYIGLYCKSGLYRIVSWVLAMIMFIKMLIVLGEGQMQMLVFGREVSLRIFTVTTGIICFYLARRLYKWQESAIERRNELYFSNFYVFCGTFLLAMLTFLEIERQFISLTWGIIAFVLFAIGFLSKDRYFRYSALLMVGVTILRIVFIDLAGLDILYRILAFVGLGLILLAVSYFYTRSNLAKREDNR